MTAANDLVLGAHHSIVDVPGREVLIHPGGAGTRPLLRDPEHPAWVREQRAAVPLMTSVCTGSLVYAAAGLLRGRPATTHWQALSELRALDSRVQVREHDRWVDDGDLITSAGCQCRHRYGSAPHRPLGQPRPRSSGHACDPVRPPATI